MDFEFSYYHQLMIAVGLGITIAYWIPRFFSGREPAATALLILAGLGIGLVFPQIPREIDPSSHAALWEHVSETTVIISLFGAGLRIDDLVSVRQWKPTAGLLLIGMPICIIAIAMLGTTFGMTLAAALLLGAVLAPTDPVLAGDVQVGPPLEGKEHPVRLTLTAEAGLNDGLAFPFVHLALAVAVTGTMTTEVIQHWLVFDVLFRIFVGVLGGIVVGVLLGQILFRLPRRNRLADTGAGVIAIAGVLLCYGATELVEGYGFIASFVAGLTLRRFEAGHKFHRTLHEFTNTVELALTSLLLLGLGALLPILWPSANWSHVVIGLTLIFLIRPLAGYLSLLFTDLRRRQRMVVAFYGVRGIGSIYYISYASAQVGLVNENGLWATVAFTIFASTIIHGLTAGIAVERATEGEEDGAKQREQASDAG